MDTDDERSAGSAGIANAIARGVFSAWADARYVEPATIVLNRGFTGQADYELLLEGRQHGASNVAGQLLCVATIGLVPAFFEQRIDLTMRLRRNRDDAVFSSEASDGYRAVAWTLLLPVSIFRETAGADETYQRLADHLYASLREQGAFDEPDPDDGASSRGGE